MAKLFFGDFFATMLGSFVERKPSNPTGASPGLEPVRASQEFGEALNRHARESALIMEEFAGGRYGKHHWEFEGQIDHEETAGFVGYALRKLCSEVLSRQTSECLDSRSAVVLERILEDLLASGFTIRF